MVEKLKIALNWYYSFKISVWYSVCLYCRLMTIQPNIDIFCFGPKIIKRWICDYGMQKFWSAYGSQGWGANRLEVYIICFSFVLWLSTKCYCVKVYELLELLDMLSILHKNINHIQKIIFPKERLISKYSSIILLPCKIFWDRKTITECRQMPI